MWHCTWLHDITSIQENSNFFCAHNSLFACPPPFTINLVNEITAMLRFFSSFISSKSLSYPRLYYLHLNIFIIIKSKSFSESLYCWIFQPWYYWHFVTDNSLGGSGCEGVAASFCFLEYLAAFPLSTHWMPVVTPPSCHKQKCIHWKMGKITLIENHCHEINSQRKKSHC